MSHIGRPRTPPGPVNLTYCGGCEIWSADMLRHVEKFHTAEGDPILVAEINHDGIAEDHHDI
jgi:hypothetical protein